MPFTIIRDDITKMPVDAIVNAANTELQMGGGVCGAIFSAAGANELQAACDKLAPIKTGEAVITPGFALPATYVIHAAGPQYRQWSAAQSEQYLRAAYTNSLWLAVENGCESIAFPLISSGLFGYPQTAALDVATRAIEDFLADHDIEVSLVVFDKATFAINEELRGEVARYIDKHYAEKHRMTRNKLMGVEELAFHDAAPKLPPTIAARPTDADAKLPPTIAARSLGAAPKMPQTLATRPTDADAQMPHALAARPMAAGLDDLVGNLDEPFSRTLLKLIDAKGLTDVQVYKRANLDRKLFSKIRTVKGYMPSKKTAVALAVALKLTLAETADLLARAGYALSRSQKFDVIIEYFIKSGKYNIFEINEVLFSYDQPLLGG